MGKGGLETPKHASVDDYMATLPEPMRAGLAELRATIRSAAPETEEVIAYDMPAYRSNGSSSCRFPRSRTIGACSRRAAP